MGLHTVHNTLKTLTGYGNYRCVCVIRGFFREPVRDDRSIQLIGLHRAMRQHRKHTDAARGKHATNMHTQKLDRRKKPPCQKTLSKVACIPLFNACLSVGTVVWEVTYRLCNS